MLSVVQFKRRSSVPKVADFALVQVKPRTTDEPQDCHAHVEEVSSALSAAPRQGNAFVVQHNDIHGFLRNLAAAGDETDTVTCVVTMPPLIPTSLQQAKRGQTSPLYI